jgi:hypothetical protein
MPSVARGAAGKPAEGFGAQVVQIQGAAEHRSERIRHTRSEERRATREMGRMSAKAPAGLFGGTSIRSSRDEVRL